jgi:hypothetical protein
MQLDIFNDSRDVMLRNDVLSALQQYDAAGARRARERAKVGEFVRIPWLTVWLHALFCPSAAACFPTLARCIWRNPCRQS